MNDRAETKTNRRKEQKSRHYKAVNNPLDKLNILQEQGVA